MLRRHAITQAAFLLTLTVACAWVHNSFALNQQGATCTTGAVAPIVNGVTSDGNNLVCISGTWQYPTYVMQSAAAAAGSSCSSYPAGAMRYNTTLSNVEMCNGTTWAFLAAATTTCGSPSGLSFTNVSGASLGTSYTSNTATITFTGCAGGGESVSVSGAATAQISINGGAWTTSGSISSGQTLQVRLTSSGSISTTLTATVTVGSSSTNWTVTTRSGSLEVFVTANLYVGTGIGGLSGADAICQSEAGTAGLSGTWKAIMSDGSTSAASRLTLSYPIVNASGGSTVAASNLWSGVISNVILNPSGGQPYSSDGAIWYCNHGGLVWTGTNADGSINSGGTCNNWSSGGSNAGAGGDYSNGSGGNGYTNSSWIIGAGSNSDGYCNCSGGGGLTAALYCIQQ